MQKGCRLEVKSKHHDSQVKVRWGKPWCLVHGYLPRAQCPVWEGLWGLNLRQSREDRSHRKQKCILHHGRGTRERQVVSSPFGAFKSQNKPWFGKWQCHSQSQDWSKASLIVAEMHLPLVWVGRTVPQSKTLCQLSGTFRWSSAAGNNNQLFQLLC